MRTESQPSAALEAGGRIRLDETGDIVGSAGLSVVPSRHRLRIEERWFWTWFAWDAVGILRALRASGAVRFRDPLGGEPIEVIFGGGVPEPNEAVVFRAVDEGYLSKHDEYCPPTNLFHDGTAAAPRADENGIRERCSPDSRRASRPRWTGGRWWWTSSIRSGRTPLPVEAASRFEGDGIQQVILLLFLPSRNLQGGIDDDAHRKRH